VATYGSAYFDGSGDSLQVASNAAFALSGDFSMECWVYFNGATPVGGGASGELIGMNATGGAIMCVRSGTTFTLSATGTADDISASFTFVTKTWYHLVACRTGSTECLYINGTRVATATVTRSYSQATFDVISGLNGYLTDTRVVKGSNPYGTGTTITVPTAPLTAITNTSLLTTQYNGGGNNSGFKDSSQFNFPITRNGNTTQGTFTPYGSNWSNYFSATGSYLSVPYSSDFNLTSDFTIEFWINPTNLPTSTATAAQSYCRVFSFGTYNAANSFGLEINSNDSGNIRKLISWYNATSYGLSTNNAVTTNSWQHIALVRSGTTITCYVNGTSTGTITGASAAVNTSQSFYIATLHLKKTWNLDILKF
jgi:hypothetical protein